MLSLAVIYSRALLGVRAPLVTVETHLSNGLPQFNIVGLPEAAVRESRDRVRSALLNTQFDFPMSRITVNLAPADLPKGGGRFDLSIAMGILAASKQIPMNELDHYEFVGELALSGELRAVSGVLPIAMATKASGRILVVPEQNTHEAGLVSGLSVLPAKHITDVCAHFTNKKRLSPFKAAIETVDNLYTNDMKDIIGQPQARRALEIAAAGGHSLLMEGPPGTGKTMLASRLPSILPAMTDIESLESAAINSISHQGFHFDDWQRRSFRAPHHSASSVALVGGGNPPRPGEISLAHHGVLFLDELPEFNRSVLEALREPIESGSVTISRAARQAEFPASFQLIAAMNPCPCGYSGDSDQNCRCTPDQIQRYRNKISGPLLDRIDLHIQVPRISTKILTQRDEQPASEDSTTIRQRVNQARQLQIKRSNIANAKLNNQLLNQFCPLDKKEKEFLNTAIDKLHLSARAYHRTLKVARTIADLANSNKINIQHLSEALSYRQSGE